jgi:hypothetical protein
MKKKLPYLMMLGLALLSSCASYQISTIQAPNENKTNYPFTIENDSVKIVYNFKGYNAPLTVSIQNKLNQPLYIDWNKSMLVFKDNSISLSSADVNIKGRVNGTITDGNNPYISSDINQSVNLSASKSLNIDYILPMATVKRKTIYVANEMQRNLSNKNLGYSYINYTDGSGPTKVPTATFNADDSPLKFKSHLSLYTVDDSDHIKDRIVYENNFYVSEIKNTTSKPDRITYYTEGDKNVFYTGKVTYFGRVTGSNDASLSRGMSGTNNP